jgi:hypothetical protein
MWRPGRFSSLGISTEMSAGSVLEHLDPLDLGRQTDVEAVTMQGHLQR